MFTRILVAVDGSDHAGRATDVASKLAALCEASITLIHVVARSQSATVPAELPEYTRRENVLPAEPDLLQIRGEQALTRASSRVLNAGMPAPEIRLQCGDPATRIAQYATDHRIDLIVIGQRGLGSLTGLMLGSVSQGVTQLASCACLLVK